MTKRKCPYCYHEFWHDSPMICPECGREWHEHEFSSEDADDGIFVHDDPEWALEQMRNGRTVRNICQKWLYEDGLYTGYGINEITLRVGGMLIPRYASGDEWVKHMKATYPHGWSYNGIYNEKDGEE